MRHMNRGNPSTTSNTISIVCGKRAKHMRSGEDPGLICTVLWPVGPIASEVPTTSCIPHDCRTLALTHLPCVPELAVQVPAVHVADTELHVLIVSLVGLDQAGVVPAGQGSAGEGMTGQLASMAVL
jgi:hypothetical protein